MPIRQPMEYEVTPTSIEPGMRWLTLRVKNVGSETLTGLDARLNSLDAYSISVYGTGSYISVLSPGEEHIIPFQVSANTTTSLYATLDGWQKGELFHWESPATIVNVGQEVAELVSLFAITEPYPPTQTVIRCEATVRSLTPSEGLNLEMWANTPSGAFNELAIVETKALGAQETARYTAEFTAEEEGTYTIYAYLYDGVRRIGRRTEHLYVT